MYVLYIVYTYRENGGADSQSMKRKQGVHHIVCSVGNTFLQLKTKIHIHSRRTDTDDIFMLSTSDYRVDNTFVFKNLFNRSKKKGIKVYRNIVLRIETDIHDDFSQEQPPCGHLQSSHLHPSFPQP